MSAFALRKKLLAQQSQAASPSVDQIQPAAGSISKDASGAVASRQKKTTKTRATQRVSIESREPSPRPIDAPLSRGFAELPGPSANQPDRVSESLSPSSLDEEAGNGYIPGPAQPVNFSSFRPSKTNCRKRSNGVCQLKLDEGDVCSCLKNVPRHKLIRCRDW